jgi:CO/xanthine dehydrogenase Mo-binding subunit
MKNVAHEGTGRIEGSQHKSIAAEELMGLIQDHPHYNDELDGSNQGRGISLGFWGNWGARSSVAINVNSDGTVSLISGSVDLTGARTSTAMQAAEILDLPLERINSTMADTDALSYTDTTGGSRTTVATGAAAVQAARDVVAKMKAEAAKVWDIPVETVSYGGGKFSNSVDDQTLTFAELAGKLSGPLTGQGNVNVADWSGAFGAHIVDLEVDHDTGQITILRYTATQNVGKAIHPGQVEGQIQGGAVQGIGWALYEGYEYNQETGQVLNANLLDYKLPTALDVPNIDVVYIEKPYPANPYGARGVGETPIVPPAAAIANAFYRATGKRITELPMTPARVLKALGKI